MAAVASITTSISITGLGSVAMDMSNSFSGTTPTVAVYQMKTLGTVDTPEALDLGGVSTVQGILLKAVDYDVDIDTSFDSSFSKELDCAAGESVYFKPEGTVYVNGGETDETPTYEYIVFGT